MRLGSVLQWLCCPWLNTGQLRLIFVILKAKHWLPFYFFRFICATFILSLWLVMWNLRDFCCQFFSHCLLLELLHVSKPHSILVSSITLSLPYCWNKFLCCIPSIHSSDTGLLLPMHSFFCSGNALSELLSKTAALYTFKTCQKISFCDACKKLAK